MRLREQARAANRADFEKQGLGTATLEGRSRRRGGFGHLCRRRPLGWSSDRLDGGPLPALRQRGLEAPLDAHRRPGQPGQRRDRRPSVARPRGPTLRHRPRGQLPFDQPVEELILPSLQRWRAAPVPHPVGSGLRLEWTGCRLTLQGSSDPSGRGSDAASDERAPRKGRAHRAGGGEQDRREACNQANPMVGSRVQQTCAACAEQAVEAVRNGKGGTSTGSGIPAPKAPREATTDRQGPPWRHRAAPARPRRSRIARSR
jgi:hypothetical protein